MKNDAVVDLVPPPIGPTSLSDLEKGRDVIGDTGSSPSTLPDWFDLDRYSRVYDFTKQHASTLLFSWHLSIVAGFSAPTLLDTLIHTGASNTAKEALHRYAHTAKHLFGWHVGNVFDPKTPAFASVQTVRNMHSAVRKDMNTNLPGKCPSGKQWMSQYNMAIVQSGFMGVSMTFPLGLGLNLSPQERDDYIFFWRCVGYQLGVADEFNLCGQGYPFTENMFKQIKDKVIIPDVNNPPPQYRAMAQAYCDGLNLIIFPHAISIDSTLGFLYYCCGAPVQTLDLADLARFAIFLTLAALFKYYPGVERLASWCLLTGFGLLPDISITSLGCPHVNITKTETGSTNFPKKQTNQMCAASARVHIQPINVVKARLFVLGSVLLLFLYILITMLMAVAVICQFSCWLIPSIHNAYSNFTAHSSHNATSNLIEY